MLSLCSVLALLPFARMLLLLFVARQIQENTNISSVFRMYYEFIMHSSCRWLRHVVASHYKQLAGAVLASPRRVISIENRVYFCSPRPEALRMDSKLFAHRFGASDIIATIIMCYVL